MDREDIRYFFRGPIFRVMHLRLLPIWDDYLTWDTVKVNTGKENDRTGILFARTVIFSGRAYEDDYLMWNTGKVNTVRKRYRSCPSGV